MVSPSYYNWTDIDLISLQEMHCLTCMSCLATLWELRVVMIGLQELFIVAAFAIQADP